MEITELETLILEYVAREGYRPVKPRILAKNLGLPKESHDEVKKVVKHLVRTGRLDYGPKHLVLPPEKPTAGGAKRDATERPRRPEVKLVTGVFRRATGGYGFVRPNTVKSSTREFDLFVPANKTLDAVSGDVVLVRPGKVRGRGGEVRSAGEIVEIVERSTSQFVGTYLERAGAGYVNVDGTVFAQPIFVGDPGAKGASTNDKVVIEMVRYPSHVHPGEGVIVEVLGRRGRPGVDTLSIMREYELPDQFPEDVLAAAREQAARFQELMGEGPTAGADEQPVLPGPVPVSRLDLTGLTVITIDPADARDFDDAISLERTGPNHWRLGVHIADVSYFVPRKSPLDREAYERATSVYLPDRVIPMLPEIISNHLASLQPDRNRFTKTIFVEFTPEGTRVATEWHNSVIRSCRRFNYEEIDEFLAHPHRWREKLTPTVFELLERMHTLAMILRRRRLDAGSIELTLPEVKIELDKEGRVTGARVIEHTTSHQIIEEFMLAANEAVAEWLHDRGQMFLRRNHEPPDPRKLHALTTFVRELGLECESMESRFEIKRVIAQVKGRPDEYAVNYAVLRSMAKAAYGPEPLGHYALNTKHYCHFTSPIRRYPDLTVHRTLDALAQGKRPDDLDRLFIQGEHCSEREQRAQAAERELIKIKLLTLLRDQVGQEFDAVVTGVEAYGIFAQLLKVPAEGLVHISSMLDDTWDYDERSHSLTGRRGSRYRLGDVIRVEITRVDLDRRELDFRLVKRVKKVAPDRTNRRKPAPKKRAGGKAGKKRGKRA